MTRPEKTALSLLACAVGAYLAGRFAFGVGWRAAAWVLTARERARDTSPCLDFPGGSS